MAVVALGLIVAAIMVLTTTPSSRVTVYYLGLTTNTHGGTKIVEANFSITNESHSRLSVAPFLVEEPDGADLDYIILGRALPPKSQQKITLAVPSFDRNQPLYSFHMAVEEELSGIRSIPARIRRFFELRKSKAENHSTSGTRPSDAFSGQVPLYIEGENFLFYVNLTNGPTQLD